MYNPGKTGYTHDVSPSSLLVSRGQRAVSSLGWRWRAFRSARKLVKPHYLTSLLSPQVHGLQDVTVDLSALSHDLTTNTSLGARLTGRHGRPHGFRSNL